VSSMNRVEGAAFVSDVCLSFSRVVKKRKLTPRGKGMRNVCVNPGLRSVQQSQ